MIDTGDTAWVLISAALVFLMTPGLGFFYGGMVRSKNVLTTIMQSFFIVAMISVEWLILGYTMTFGADVGGFIGSLEKFGLANVGMNVLENGTIPELAFVAFQCMFAVITPALITGAFAERMKFRAFTLFILLWAIFIYNPMAHLVWGGGFLAQLGALDFAGGLVIHILSGVSGLTLCILLGKRRGYGKTAMLPHNLPMTVLGAALLWFGWFGFNAGSALGANALAANAFIASQGAAAAATVSWVLLEWVRSGKPTVLGAASGCIAGLVAITPAAGFVAPMPAIFIGFVGGAVCYGAVAVLKEKMGYDDSLDAFGVHGLGGTWGSIATGLFATTSGAGHLDDRRLCARDCRQLRPLQDRQRHHADACGRCGGDGRSRHRRARRAWLHGRDVLCEPDAEFFPRRRGRVFVLLQHDAGNSGKVRRHR